MNIQPYVESVRKVFPEASFQEIVLQFDTGQKRFVHDTKLYENTADLENIDSNIAWTLPSDWDSLKRIDYYDEDGEPLYVGSDIHMDVDIEGGYIYFKSTTGTLLDDAIDDDNSLDSVILTYYAKPSAITSVSSSWTVADDEDKEAVVG